MDVKINVKIYNRQTDPNALDVNPKLPPRQHLPPPANPKQPTNLNNLPLLLPPTLPSPPPKLITHINANKPTTKRFPRFSLPLPFLIEFECNRKGG